MADISNQQNFLAGEELGAGPAAQGLATAALNPLNTGSLQKLRVVLAAPYRMAANIRKQTQAGQ